VAVRRESISELGCRNNAAIGPILLTAIRALGARPSRFGAESPVEDAAQPARHSAARPRARGETEIASDFTAIMEVAKEYLVGHHPARLAQFQSDKHRRRRPAGC